MLWLSLILALTAPQQGEGRQRQAHEPDPRALVRALANDGIAGNARQAWQQLLQAGLRAQAALAAGLESADPQQRFLSATALAHAGARKEDVGMICAVLWPHLEANQVPGDLEMAQAALARMGTGEHRRAVIGWIREARRSSGGQATGAIEGIGLRLGLHDDWRRIYAWPSLHPRFVLRQDASWPMLQPRAARWTPARHASELVLALGADGLGRNASAAERELSERITEEPIRRALRRALFDADHQRRHFAWGIWVLAVHPYWGEAAEIPEQEIPWETLDQMALEALAEDRFSSGAMGWGNAGRAIHYFEQRGAAAWGVLRHGLVSGDPVQRVRCAVLQITTGDPLAGASITVLQAALQDNKLRNDQMAAEHALISAGPAALDWLASVGPAADPQERAARARIRQHIQKLNPELQERHRWRALARLSSLGSSSR
ncbi:MAG: hypothetical protein CMJ94_03605 [Planctomycetes bacterium]|nr:hypothetical protein [Planctomycetota bacterium]